MSDARRHKRALLNSEATFKGNRFWVTCRVGNICEGGLFLYALPSEDLGTEVDLEFELPNKELPVLARGVVIWRKERGVFTGGGIRFTLLYRMDRDLIRRYIQEQTADGKREF